MGHHRAAAPVAAFLLLAGCGDAGPTAGEPLATIAYDGPLHLSREEARHPGAGAAGDVVDCDTWGDGGFSEDEVYGDGTTADSPGKALQVARSEWAFGGIQDGLALAREEPDRVLYVLEVGGAVKQAVILHDGPATEGAGGPGWYVESWAHCDYAELPRSFTDEIGLQVWTDESGAPVPTTKVQSWTGPAHCDWESMTFLYLGDDEEVSYIREPQPELAEFFHAPYVARTRLPEDAADTGFEHDGRHLWLSPDRQRAYVGTRDAVEVWPRPLPPLGCE